MSLLSSKACGILYLVKVGLLAKFDQDIICHTFGDLKEII